MKSERVQQIERLLLELAELTRGLTDGDWRELGEQSAAAIGPAQEAAREVLQR
jgi:hypothetical protein